MKKLCILFALFSFIYLGAMEKPHKKYNEEASYNLIRIINKPLPGLVINRDQFVLNIRNQIEAGADPNLISTDFQRNILFTAVILDDLNLITFLLNKGANPNIADSVGRTPLMHAAERRRTRIVSVLLQANADALLQDNKGGTVLHIAACHGSAELVKQFFTSDNTPPIGNQLKIIKNRSGQTPLDVALVWHANPSKRAKRIIALLQQKPQRLR